MSITTRESATCAQSRRFITGTPLHPHGVFGERTYVSQTVTKQQPPREAFDKMLPWFVRRGVELCGQLLKEVGPVTVSMLSFLFAEPDDHQVLLGSDIYVLPVVTASGEVVLPVGCVYPPEVLVAQGGVGGCV